MKGIEEYRTISLRPGKAVSAGSFVGMIFMLLFGAGFTVIVANVLFTNDVSIGVTILFFVFMIGWMGTAVFMLVYHLLNWKGARGVPLFEVELAKGSLEQATAQDPANRPRSQQDVNK